MSPLSLTRDQLITINISASRCLLCYSIQHPHAQGGDIYSYPHETGCTMWGYLLLLVILTIYVNFSPHRDDRVKCQQWHSAQMLYNKLNCEACETNVHCLCSVGRVSVQRRSSVCLSVLASVKCQAYVGYLMLLLIYLKFNIQSIQLLIIRQQFTIAIFNFCMLFSCYDERQAFKQIASLL